MIVGVLHDVVEDTMVTLEDLRILGASEEIVTAIEAITKKEGEDYDAYLSRVRANPLARRVKLMDATHNRLEERIAQVPSIEKQAKFRLKYDHVIQVMQE